MKKRMYFLKVKWKPAQIQQTKKNKARDKIESHQQLGRKVVPEKGTDRE